MTSSQNTVFFLVAGEESGDIHGARLISALKEKCPDASFVGHGGNKMKSAGMEILEHVDDLAMRLLRYFWVGARAVKGDGL